MGVKFGYTSSKRRKGLVERPESCRRLGQAHGQQDARGPQVTLGTLAERLRIFLVFRRFRGFGATHACSPLATCQRDGERRG